MTVHLVIGAPCSGKSTFVNKMRSDIDPRIDFDALATAIGNKQPHDAPKDIRSVAFAARKAGIARILDGIDSDAWIIHHRPSDDTIAKAIDDGHVVHVVDPGLDECLQRARRDNRTPETLKLIEKWYENPPVLPDKTQKGRIMTHKTGKVAVKTLALDIKSDESTLADGQFEGYASVFGNIDSYGDKVIKGAFAESLKTYGKDGAGIPCYWQHNTADPLMNIGQTVKAFEDDHGLRVTVQLDLDNEKAAYVHKMIKENRVKQMSFAYEITDGENTDDCFEIKACNIFEVSVVPVGANQETELLAVKSAWLATKADDEEPANEPTPEDEPEQDEEETELDVETVKDFLQELADNINDFLTKFDGEDTDPDEDSEDTTPETENGNDEAVKARNTSGMKTLARANALLQLMKAKE